jgi:hypothetical protein
MTKFYLATCEDCEPRLPQPFYDEDKRNKWAVNHHEGTGWSEKGKHTVTISEEDRP